MLKKGCIPKTGIRYDGLYPKPALGDIKKILMWFNSFNCTLAQDHANVAQSDLYAFAQLLFFIQYSIFSDTTVGLYLRVFADYSIYSIHFIFIITDTPPI